MTFFFRLLNAIRRWSEDRRVPDAYTWQQLKAVNQVKVLPFRREP